MTIDEERELFGGDERSLQAKRALRTDEPKRCVWCNEDYPPAGRACCAPDGDGHLWWPVKRIGAGT